MDDNLYLYGTNEEPKKKELYKIEDFQFYYSEGELEEVRYKSVEILRKISFLIRDENWGTWSLHVDKLAKTETEEEMDLVIDGYFFMNQKDKCPFVTKLKIRNNKTFSLSTTITPCNNILTNRAGFILLHPLDGVCGKEVVVTSGDKTATRKFPYLVSPIQPLLNVNRIKQSIKGVDLEIVLHADSAFECEDQRNWTDASYKTYYRPLSDPFPYKLIRNQSVTQEITINILSCNDDKIEQAVVIRSKLEEKMPILYEYCDKSVLDPGSISVTGKKIIRIDSTKIDWRDKLQPKDGLKEKKELILEVILPDNEKESDNILEEISQIVPENTYLIPLPQGYLKSYQPMGDFPLHLTPSQALVIANRYFKKEFLGAGVLTYFTEFNRCGIASHLAGFIYHCNSATIHDTDDTSVMQTLESLPFVYETAKARTGSYLPYRLGLSTIALQSNPYGDSMGENESNTRATMSSFDPRHRGLFGASWIVGFVATTQGHSLQSFCFSSEQGAFASRSNSEFYPVFHILKVLAKASGKSRVLPPEIKDLALVYWKEGVQTHGLVANMTQKHINVNQKELAISGMKVAILDKSSARKVGSEEDFFKKTKKTKNINLTEYAVCYFQEEVINE